MVIIRCNSLMRRDNFFELHADLVNMARTGVILLPDCCELLNEVPADTEVVVVKNEED